MVDNKITGRAKKYDGTAIDYVSIFNWTDGKCIAQVTPDAAGVWSYRYLKTIKVGISYIADGCEPITHGAYEFILSTPEDTILHYNFNGNVLDNSANNLNGIKTGAANFVAGRKAGTQAIEFTGGLVKTPSALSVGSNKLTASFWISTTQTNTAIIYEASENSNASRNAFAGLINDTVSGSVQSSQLQEPGKQNIATSTIDRSGTWQHVMIEIDRDKGALLENKIYINNVLTSVMDSTYRNETVQDFQGYVLYIGQRVGGIVPFSGKLQDMRLYNRLLSTEEKTALFNE